ncbi:hypothetical protein C8R46DRAFT_1098418 [Mycena filopes]|nr:hypothetical protein C8R46DRAFT_1098418 [Mycena filopes]
MPSTPSDIFAQLAPFLDKHDRGSNTLRGRYLKEIDRALKYHPFTPEEGNLIDSAQSARQRLGEEFYDLLPANHPRLSENRRAENVNLQVYVLRVDKVEGSDKLKVRFMFEASWVAGAKHGRSPGSTTGKLPQYEELDNSQWQRRIFDDNKDRALDAFLGPPLRAKSVLWDDERIVVDEEPLDLPDFLLKKATKEDAGVKFTAQTTFEADFISRGNSEGFPFDQETVVLHLTSDVPIEQIHLLCQGTDKSTVVSHFSRSRYWVIHGVQIEHRYRNEQHEDLGEVQDGAGILRSKIIVTVTLKRNTGYWFWKALIPMDVITLVGITPLLLIPKVVPDGPTPDQRLLLVTVAVIVLVAQARSSETLRRGLIHEFIHFQAAFITSVQPILPDVSYVTVMEYHNTFCLVITAVEAFLVAAISDEAWVSLGAKFRIYPVFGAFLLLLILEHACLALFSRRRVV